jgi:hypothetical protein
VHTLQRTSFASISTLTATATAAIAIAATTAAAANSSSTFGPVSPLDVMLQLVYSSITTTIVRHCCTVLPQDDPTCRQAHNAGFNC